MKTFSEYLSDYAAGNQISWQKAALLCDMDRTLLSRYASGKRLPENLDKVKKIARGLNMTKQQTEEFKILYQISKRGDFSHKALDLIRQIFSGQKICPFSMPARQQPQHIWQERRVYGLYGAEEICDAADWLVRNASFLRVHMGAIGKDCLLFPILAAAGCRIEHLLPIGYGLQGQTAVEAFEKLIPFLFLGKKYQVYCYYWWPRMKAEADMHMVLGDQGILIFSSDFTRGVFTGQAQYREYYEKMYLDKVKKSRIYGGSGQGLFEKREHMENEYYLKNPFSGVSFVYQNMFHERIWVKTGGGTPGSFYLEEVELVKLFRIFMDYAGMWGGGIEDRQEKE